MILLRKQREAIGNYLLKRKLKRQQRMVQMQKLSEIQSACIFFNASSEPCRKEAKTLIKKLTERKVKVHALGLFLSKKPEIDFISDKNLYFATLKDFSSFFLPKSEEVCSFAEQAADILFVFSDNSEFPARTLVELSRASLKVGFAGPWNNALDVTFEIPGREPEQLMQQIERYLQ